VTTPTELGIMSEGSITIVTLMYTTMIDN
jgi:hypothetical protein